MNIITKKPIAALGYNFIPAQYIPKGKDEYYLRNKQHRTKTKYRNLTPAEIKTLEKNDNSSDNWKNVFVSDAFNPALVKRCSFFGLVRIGKLEALFHEFNNLHMPVGLYNSTIISCDFGDNVVVDNVNFMSHYIVGNDVMLVNINELAATDHAKFGNGVLKEGEKEAVRIWLEVCNENAGRSILPFNGMLPADAWLWSKYRDDEALLQKFKDFTDKQFDTRRGYYGKIGDRTVIKNCKIIKDTWIGSDAYLKGANKIKNITINSAPDAKSQIGEGCELVNGIIGFGCRIFYGVKAVRFFMGSNSQLKYGARLINSYLSDNSTISCCEVLNSLIFPAHEQHHNNSFLCAATVMGQSNMAAGATIGSNHNSRGADGEIVAGRGFWPGLCVSLKHNSKFACFTILAKGDYPAELNIPIPFSLVSNDVANDRLTIMPGYWFLYNMYALARNAAKYESRDNRTDKSIDLEYGYLAPDSINEMLAALKLMKQATATAWAKKNKTSISANAIEKKGEELLTTKADEIKKLEILVDGIENTNRKVQLQKVAEAFASFKEMIVFYAITELVKYIDTKKITSWQKLESLITSGENGHPIAMGWLNMGGQLMPAAAVSSLKAKIKTGKISNWDEVHQFYQQQNRNYPQQKARHAVYALLTILQIPPKKLTRRLFIGLLKESISIRKKITDSIYQSRAKDYENPFRKVVYNSAAEMESVIGKLSDNSFIKDQQQELVRFTHKMETVIKKLS